MAEWKYEQFTVTDERSRLDLAVIHGFLRRSYWAPEVPLDVVRRSIEHSLCFGAFADGRQVGFARVITDRSTFAYLADVFVLEEWRGHGLSKFLVRCVRAHPELQNLRRWMLATADAHGLYRQFGFHELREPQRLMEIVDREIYQRMR